MPWQEISFFMLGDLIYKFYESLSAPIIQDYSESRSNNVFSEVLFPSAARICFGRRSNFIPFGSGYAATCSKFIFIRLNLFIFLVLPLFHENCSILFGSVSRSGESHRKKKLILFFLCFCRENS